SAPASPVVRSPRGLGVPLLARALPAPPLSLRGEVREGGGAPLTFDLTARVPPAYPPPPPPGLRGGPRASPARARHGPGSWGGLRRAPPAPARTRAAPQAGARSARSGPRRSCPPWSARTRTPPG